jgi:ABC-type sugar transport system ATPase subunit
MIADAMWGKSILFVSEKMAALGVVKDRIDHMGLGLFCLEVHYAKATKAQVLHTLKERMDAAASAPTPKRSNEREPRFSKRASG